MSYIINPYSGQPGTHPRDRQNLIRDACARRRKTTQLCKWDRCRIIEKGTTLEREAFKEGRVVALLAREQENIGVFRDFTRKLRIYNNKEKEKRELSNG